MKRFIAVLMTLILLMLLCACNGSSGKKQVVVVEKVVITSSEDTGSNEPDETQTDTSSEPETQYSYEAKKAGTDIGKDYYYLSPEVAHPGVVGMDATYTMVAKDKRFYQLDSDRIVLSSTNKNIKIEGDQVVIPYSVRKSESVTVTMTDKQYPNRTGSYTFKFVSFTDDPTFFDDFNTIDLSIWSDDFFNFKEDKIKPIETAFCEDGELVLRTTKEDHDGTKLGYHLTTSGSFDQAYGCFSARIKMPTKGLTNVAFWLFSESGGRYIKNQQMPSQSGGEIDIVEYFPIWGNYRLSHALHWNGQGAYLTSAGREPTLSGITGKIQNEYHIYSAVWTENAIYYYFDDKLTYTYEGEGVAAGSDPMFLIVQHNSYRNGEYNAWAKQTADVNDFPNESRWDWVKTYGIKDVSRYVYGKGLDYKNAE